MPGCLGHFSDPTGWDLGLVVRWRYKRTHTDPINNLLGGGLLHFFIFTPIPGERIQFDDYIFQMGWFNH